tara:strand:+ start:353 stop:520 length:168 start_codon:yes stop_codon:yes gene_type:complete
LQEVVLDTYIQILQKVVDMVVVEIVVMVHQLQVVQEQLALAAAVAAEERLSPQVE